MDGTAGDAEGPGPLPPPLPPWFVPVPPPDDLMSGFYRSGAEIVLERGKELPADRCVKCLAPADGGLLRQPLVWYPPALVVILVLNPIVGAVVILAVQKRATLLVPLCRKHRDERRRFLLMAWSFLPLSGLFVAGAILLDRPPFLLPAGVAFLAWLAMLAIVRRMPVRATRIDDEEIRLRGACPEYLARLPE